MAKKGKNDAPNANSVPNRDIMQRLNFLYQASTYLNGLPLAASSSGAASTSDTQDAMYSSAKKRDNRKRCSSARDLSRAYLEDAKIVAQKTTVRLDPSVKRTVCKNCNSLLVPGISCRVRVRQSSSHRHSVSTICNNCNMARRIPAPPVGSLEPSNEGSSELADVDMLDAQPAAIGSPARPRQKKVSVAHKIPLFQRDGHVVFRGNQELAPVSTDQDTFGPP